MLPPHLQIAFMLLKQRLEERGWRWCVRQHFNLHPVAQVMTDQKGMQSLSKLHNVNNDIFKFPLYPKIQSTDQLPRSGTVEYTQQDSNSQTHWAQRFGQND